MKHTLSVPGRYDRLEQICEFIARAALAAGFDESDSNRCQLAVDEACTNIIEHGYGGEDKGSIDLVCETTPSEFIIIITDHADHFDPASVPDPNIGAALEDLQIGGLGLYFMRQVMDSVEFNYAAGGNRLILTKRLPK